MPFAKETCKQCKTLASRPKMISPRKCKNFDTKERTRSILHLAVEAKREQLVELLITKEPRLIPLIHRAHGETALHMAAKAGFVEIVRLLIEKDPKAAWCCADYDHTPLHWAAWAGQEEVVKVLLSHDLNLIDAVGLWGYNVFHLAAQLNRPKVLAVLIKYCPSSKLNALTAAIAFTAGIPSSGSTPLLLGSHHEEVVELLLVANPDLAFATDGDKNTVLHRATDQHYLSLRFIEVLLKLYPEAVNVLNRHSRLPLDVVFWVHGSRPFCDLEAVVKALILKMCFDDVNMSWKKSREYLRGGGYEMLLKWIDQVLQSPLTSVVLPKELVRMVREYVDYQSLLTDGV